MRDIDIKFLESYELVYHFDCDEKEKVFIGTKDERICRFCGKNINQVSFRKDAHVIPEMLGNKKIFSNKECDVCNEKFGNSIEKDFASYTLPIRTLNSLKGKKKKPKYKSNDKKTEIETEVERVIKIISQKKVNISDNTICLEFDIEPYIPINIYKMLVKIALSIMDEEYFQKFKLLFMWLTNTNIKELEELPIPSSIIYTEIEGFNVFKSPKIWLFKCNDKCITEYYNYIFIIAFSNCMYQIIIPSDEEYLKFKERKNIKLFQPIYYNKFPKLNFSYEKLDFSKKERIKEKMIKYLVTDSNNFRKIPIELAQRHFDGKISYEELLEALNNIRNE